MVRLRDGLTVRHGLIYRLWTAAIITMTPASYTILCTQEQAAVGFEF